MAKYKLTGQENTILNTETGSWIPKGHRLWIEYEEWLSEGNTPDPQFNLDQLKENKINQVKREYIYNISNPLAVTTQTGKSFNIDIDEKAQTDWNKLITLSQLFTTPVQIRDADNLTQDLTFDEFKEVLGQIGIKIQELWLDRCTKIDAVKAANTQTKFNKLTF